MVCPLGGKYVLQRGGRRRRRIGPRPRWKMPPSRRAACSTVHAPPGYQSPPLSWFRGLDLDATMTEKTVSAHAEIIMQMPAGK